MTNDKIRALVKALNESEEDEHYVLVFSGESTVIEAGVVSNLSDPQLIREVLLFAAQNMATMEEEDGEYVED